MNLFLLLGGFAFTMVFAGCGQKDPVQSQTEWQGKCSQDGFEPYPMIMQIESRKGDEISGELRWPTLRNSKTRFRGVVENRRVSWVEYKLVEGGNIGFPTLYHAEIIGNALGGTWVYAEDSGTFYLERVEK